MTDGGTAWWASEPEKKLYKKAVYACLHDRDLSALLGSAAAVTREDVAEAMCSWPYVDNVLGSGRPRPRHARYRLSRRLSDLYLWALPEPPSLHAIRGNPAFRLWTMGVLLGWGLTLVFLFRAGVPLGLIYPFLFVVAPALAFARRVAPAPSATPVWRYPAHCLLLGPVTSVLWCWEVMCGSLWIREMERHGLLPQVELATRRLVDEVGEPLLVTGSSEGLRSLAYGRSLVVETESQDQLRSRMAGLSDGTIALSGSRGVGKTTLIRSCVDDTKDFAVLAHAPAAYDPHEFLTSLFVLVCREYICWVGGPIPDLVRLSVFHRVRRRTLGFLRTVLPRLPYALPAAALVGLGMFAATKQVIAAKRGVWGEHQLVLAYEQVSVFVRGVLQGDRPIAAMAVVLAGGAIWTLRRSQSFGRLFRVTCRNVFMFVAGGLVLGPFFSVFFDPGIRRHFSELPAGQAPTAITSLVLLVLCWWLYVAWATSPAALRRRMQTEGRAVAWQRWVDATGTLFPFGVLAFVLVHAPLRPLLTDDETPLRTGAFLLGLLIGQLLNNPPRLRIPTELITDCRDLLYRLQTIQSSSTALSTGVTPFFSLGTSHADGLTSVPPNPPMLVRECRELLVRIAQAEHDKGNRVVIAIDEIDRLGTDRQALAFLTAIKAVLGVPHVHYLLSVAEDVGAAFLRRGLPHRDVTDSSLDDVLHVPPCSFDESKDILNRRLTRIDYPYIALAHGLSGGIPRDLIRHARRLVAISKETGRLKDVAHALVDEELFQTLAGFRTLLAKGPETSETVAALDAFRSLVAHLQAARERPEATDQLRGALALFVRYDVAGLPDESRQLVEEARAYAYFCLTLLDVFGHPDHDHRLTETGRHDRRLELLATARQELAVSPRSARSVLDMVRCAWQLDQLSGREPVGEIPPPRAAPDGHRDPFS